MILITYTTLYREGGAQIEQAAETLAKEKRAARPGAEVRLARVESKRAFVDAIAASEAAGGLDELHFLGHSGMYGPMFRTTAMPEQLSPHEWRTLRIPFKPGGQAFFHACRTARWFAPFFARTFGVPAHGFHWYTSFSRRADRFRWPGLAYPEGAPLYLIGVKGKKSHGLLGTLGKYAGLAGAEPMRRYEPAPVEGDASYDSVADLYDAVFDDIRVREDEWRWLEAHIPRSPAPRVLDLGCGNGALLQALAGRVASGHGVDASAGMIRAATRRNRAAHLAFTTIDGPTLPFPDASFDVVVSLLSFRYLDWDPVMNEVRRVLAPGGRLLVVDMVTAPVTAKEAPRFLRDTARGAVGRVRRPAFGRALGRLVKDPRWATMLAYNPIRAQHELVWYLESRFPGRRVELLNVGFHARVLAFDSGPLEPGAVAPQSYP
ncbi:MAG: methyltransferase domain-containing protein [Deltaproteobacteria bacterium]|nr:methyltransferase domain-containing protein [Deltaproteobacteria bacterium]